MEGHNGSAAHTARRLHRLTKQLVQEATRFERVVALPGDLLGTYISLPGAVPEDIHAWLDAVLVERDSSQELVVTIVAR